ncbi:MAG: type II secretion system F family protein [Gemmatimonadaceae bacterium]|nr:type II secretion system F family protein [Gemmatimonadaceae bacterium]
MILILTAVFLAVLATAVMGYLFVNRQSLAAADIARERLRTDEPEKVWTVLKDERSSDIPFMQRLMAGKDWSEIVRLQLLRAGSNQKPGAFVLIWVVVGLVGTLAASRLETAIFSLLITVVSWAAPFFWLRWRQKKRTQAFGEQLPDAIDMLVSAMKAGYSFQAATQFIGEEMIDPLGAEFSRFYDEQRLGIEVRNALYNMEGRIDSLDFKMFVTAVVIQRETGGNLSEVLSGLADLIRGRMAIKGHIETLVAEPKMSAKFLAAIPLIVFLLITAINPDFMRPMVNSEGGRLMLGAAVVSVIIGYMVMMKIADVDV